MLHPGVRVSELPREQLSNVTAAGTKALNRGHIDDQLENCYAAGGMPNVLFCNTFQYRRLAAIYEPFITTERSETTGGNRIKWLEVPLPGASPIQIIVDRWAPATTVDLIDTRYCGFITLDPFFYEKLAKTGDSSNGQVVGEYGFVLAFEKAHARITGLTSS